MWKEDETLGSIVMLSLPALVAVTVVLLYFMLSEVLTFLTAWILASFPIGVLVGHCALSEETSRPPG